MLALWYKFAWNYDANITDEHDEDTDYGEEQEGDDHLTEYQHVFNLTWPRYLLAMAQQYDVPIAGVTEIEETVKKDLESIKGLKLPKKRVDRFKFKDIVTLLPLLRYTNRLTCRHSLPTSSSTMDRSWEVTITM